MTLLHPLPNLRLCTICGMKCKLKPTARFLTVSATRAAPPLPPRSTVDEKDIEEAFLKGSGPGGQKINKTSSAVQLKHLPTGTVVKSQATRSRSQNRTIARRLLADKLEEADKGPQSRVAIKAEIKKKKKASSSKKARRKYRDLQDAARDQAPWADDVPSSKKEPSTELTANHRKRPKP